MPVYRIVLEGNIGIGKTSVANGSVKYNDIHKDFDKVIIMLEPLTEVKIYLDKYYNDLESQENCFEVQIAFFYHFSRLTTNIQEIIKNNATSDERILIIIERAPPATRYVFIENLKKVLSKGKNYYSVLDKLSQYYINHEIWKTSKYVILACDTNTCFKRLQTRDNPSDKLITLDYLNTISSLYDDLLLKLKDQIILTLNTDILSIEECVLKMFETIKILNNN